MHPTKSPRDQPDIRHKTSYNTGAASDSGIFIGYAVGKSGLEACWEYAQSTPKICHNPILLRRLEYTAIGTSSNTLSLAKNIFL